MGARKRPSWKLSECDSLIRFAAGSAIFDTERTSRAPGIQRQAKLDGVQEQSLHHQDLGTSEELEAGYERPLFPFLTLCVHILIPNLSAEARG